MADTAQTLTRNRVAEPLPFDDRARRVLEFRRLIREGRYRPDPREVAEALAREWGALGGQLDTAPGPEVGQSWCEAASRFVVERSTSSAEGPVSLTA